MLATLHTAFEGDQSLGGERIDAAGNQFTLIRLIEKGSDTTSAVGLYIEGYNPAGVAFMADGHHLAINWQLAYQTRHIENDYMLFTNNVNNAITPRTFKGKALAPVIPSFQYAYNKNRW